MANGDLAAQLRARMAASARSTLAAKSPNPVLTEELLTPQIQPVKAEASPTQTTNVGNTTQTNQNSAPTPDWLGADFSRVTKKKQDEITVGGGDNGVEVIQAAYDPQAEANYWASRHSDKNKRFGSVNITADMFNTLLDDKGVEVNQGDSGNTKRQYSEIDLGNGVKLRRTDEVPVGVNYANNVFEVVGDLANNKNKYGKDFYGVNPVSGKMEYLGSKEDNKGYGLVATMAPALVLGAATMGAGGFAAAAQNPVLGTINAINSANNAVTAAKKGNILGAILGAAGTAGNIAGFGGFGDYSGAVKQVTGLVGKAGNVYNAVKNQDALGLILQGGQLVGANKDLLAWGNRGNQVLKMINGNKRRR